MIEIIKLKNSVEIKGHAHFALIGQDIVCAGVSALTQTLIAALDDLRQLDEYEAEIGYVKVTTKSLDERGEAILRAFLIGVSLIQDEYPENVNVSRRG